MVKESEYMTISDLATVRAALNLLTGLHCLDEPNLSRKIAVVKKLDSIQIDLEGRRVRIEHET